MPPPPRVEIRVDLDVISANVALLAERVAPAALMAVVKADGYGHGLLESARAARRGGAPWLGVATPEEALALRADGDAGPLLCWLTTPGDDLAPVVAAGVDVTAYDAREVAAIADTAAAVGRPARLQLKVDTGLSRGGATPEDWPGLVDAALRARDAGLVDVTGTWSHLACADEPAHPANDAQQAAFDAALAVMAQRGVDPGVRHLANSAASLLRPGAHYDLVRCGIATYGVDPAPGAHDLAASGLRQAMTVRARVATVKRIRAGASVSYGHRWTAPADTWVALVPAGYGDGVPRHGTNVLEVLLGGRRRPVRGTVCMDQVVVELGPDDADRVEPGEVAVLIGDAATGAATADEWAAACGTIGYEIVTRMGGWRTVRTHHGEGTAP
ncbi:alanine racemase [uncultured Nocardioides sp.]|uniref:alanine racemase n=1 Tax=uncultured Nocardioides sp. TaxID=198441 RepID=UPI00262F3E92|nr:alanine racemase [uncultured Nocardioides sp.]